MQVDLDRSTNFTAVASYDKRICEMFRHEKSKSTKSLLKRSKTVDNKQKDEDAACGNRISLGNIHGSGKRRMKIRTYMLGCIWVSRKGRGMSITVPQQMGFQISLLQEETLFKVFCFRAQKRGLRFQQAQPTRINLIPAQLIIHELASLILVLIELNLLFLKKILY